MNDARAVRVGQRVAQADGDGDHRRDAEALAGHQEAIERAPFEALERHVGPEVAALAGVAHRDDPRVARAGERPGFAGDALGDAPLLAHLCGEHLERDDVPEHHVLGLVHHTHSASRDLAAHPVPAVHQGVDGDLCAIAGGSGTGVGNFGMRFHEDDLLSL
jgi:hypothetical protein